MKSKRNIGVAGTPFHPAAGGSPVGRSLAAPLSPDRGGPAPRTCPHRRACGALAREPRSEHMPRDTVVPPAEPNTGQLRKLLRQRESVRAVVETISGELELQPLLESILRHACELIGAEQRLLRLRRHGVSRGTEREHQLLGIHPHRIDRRADGQRLTVPIRDGAAVSSNLGDAREAERGGQGWMFQRGIPREDCRASRPA